MCFSSEETVWFNTESLSIWIEIEICHSLSEDYSNKLPEKKIIFIFQYSRLCVEMLFFFNFAFVCKSINRSFSLYWNVHTNKYQWKCKLYTHLKWELYLSIMFRFYFFLRLFPFLPPNPSHSPSNTCKATFYLKCVNSLILLNSIEGFRWILVALQATTLYYLQ